MMARSRLCRTEMRNAIQLKTRLLLHETLPIAPSVRLTSKMIVFIAMAVRVISTPYLKWQTQTNFQSFHNLAEHETARAHCVIEITNKIVYLFK